MDHQIDNLSSDQFRLPLTANALSRQANRTKKALEEFLLNPPPKVKLSAAQEFLAKIWGRTNFHHLKSSVIQQEHKPCATSHRESISLFQRIGVARSEMLVRTFIEDAQPAQTEAKSLALRLAGIILKLEEQTRLAQESPLILAGEEAILTKLELDLLRKQHPFLFRTDPYTARSLDYWLDMRALENAADQPVFEFVDSKGQSRTLVVFSQSCTQATSIFLRDLPGYEKIDIKSMRVTEATKDYFKAAVRILRPIFDLIHEIEVSNPLFWDSRWNAYVDHIFGSYNALRNLWPLHRESWLREPNSEVWFIREIGSNSGQFRAIDALSLLSFGANSSSNHDLLAWMKKISVVTMISESLVAFIEPKLQETGLLCGFSKDGRHLAKDLLDCLKESSDDLLLQALSLYGDTKAGRYKVPEIEAHTIFMAVISNHEGITTAEIALELAKCIGECTANPVDSMPWKSFL